MTKEERDSCINTVNTLRRLALNIHGVIDVIDSENCDKIINMLKQTTKDRPQGDLEVIRQEIEKQKIMVSGSYLTKDQKDIFRNAINVALAVIDKHLQNPQEHFDWYDVLSDEMTLEQARQAVKDLRKKLVEHLEQEHCEDAISRQEAVEAFQMFREYESNRSNKEWVNRIETVLNQLPPVNPTKIGHWIFVDKAHEHAHCSECDYGNVDLLDGRPHNYCPNCGCRMIDPQESEEV